MRSLRRDDGQLAPLLALVVVGALAALGLLFLQLSRAGDLRSGAQTAADAAALAAADEYVRQVEELLDGPGLGRAIQFLRDPDPDRAPMLAAATRLAAANGAAVEDFAVQGDGVAVLARGDTVLPDSPTAVGGDGRARSQAQARAAFPVLASCRVEDQPEPTPSPLPSPSGTPDPDDPAPTTPPPPPPLPDLLVCDGIRVELPVGRIVGALRDRLLEHRVRLVPVTADLG